nr:MAG TPA_asm: hypothetical protein [Bacteriophage sp.]
MQDPGRGSIEKESPRLNSPPQAKFFQKGLIVMNTQSLSVAAGR